MQKIPREKRERETLPANCFFFFKVRLRLQGCLFSQGQPGGACTSKSSILSPQHDDSTYPQETTETTALTTSEAEAGVNVSYAGSGQQNSIKMEVVNGCHQIVPKKR